MNIDSSIPGPERKKRKVRFYVALSLAAAVAAAAALALLVNIFGHRQESRTRFYRVVALDDSTTAPAVWGKNFPLQYEGYLHTATQEPTRFGGSKAVPRTPDRFDPRSVVAQSRLEEDPRLKTIWAGYAFSVDYRKKRGHAYMLEDQMYTERQRFAHQPGTCIHCHASVYAPYRKLGGGDLVLGFEKMNPMPYAGARKLVEHPLACIDCHDPADMQLRVTRPGFIEGIRALKASQGIANYDVNAMASRQEMRSYVCGQCHVEYYFKGEEKRLVYPWAKGLSVDRILVYYEETAFKDWTHADTGAPMLKAQHPEFETWNQGIHARSNVACADCHMPYQRSGAMKISDHNVRSPLLNINRACQTCHKWSEEELRSRAEQIQERTVSLSNTAMDALTEMIGDIRKALASGISPAQIETARGYQRKAQFLLDFVEAENSTGFHAPQESARILAESINYSRLGQRSLAVSSTR